MREAILALNLCYTEAEEDLFKKSQCSNLTLSRCFMLNYSNILNKRTQINIELTCVLVLKVSVNYCFAECLIDKEKPAVTLNYILSTFPIFSIQSFPDGNEFLISIYIY